MGYGRSSKARSLQNRLCLAEVCLGHGLGALAIRLREERLPTRSGNKLSKPARVVCDRRRTRSTAAPQTAPGLRGKARSDGIVNT
jgi:hypothetical protein